MNELPEGKSILLSKEDAHQLLRSLLEKQGSWVDWGKSCYQLQKSGYDGQTIFEQTGFQASQQNLIIVAAQVYESLVNAKVSETLLNYFLGPKSDVLYELRILDQDQRVAVARLSQEKTLIASEAREAAKTYQNFCRLSQLPDKFTNHPGDAIAHQCWKQARQKKELQDRTRLIVKGLKFVYSPTARDALEKLLSDFTVLPSCSAPLLPLYRLEEQSDMSCIVPVAGKLPLSQNDWEQVDTVEAVEPFNLVSYSGTGSLVSLPGWQALLKADEPVGILCSSDRLPKSLLEKPETVLVIVDRGVINWNSNSYFLIEEAGELIFKWFESKPHTPLLGQIILVVCPKKIFDKDNIFEPWQIDD